MKFRRTKRARAKTELRKKVRLQVFERSGGKCELNNRDDCLGVVPFESKDRTPYDHGHLVHVKSEGSGDKTDMENCRWGCWKCHLLGGHRGETRYSKPVPPKRKQDWTEGYYGN